MNRRKFLILAGSAVTAVWLLLSPFMGAFKAAAAEVKLLSGRGFSSVIDVLVGDFERATGHTVTVSYGPGHKISERVRNDEVVDVVIIPLPLVNELAKQNKIIERSIVNIAHSDVGLGVRSGTAKPDPNSLDAFKAWLLAAKIIVCSDPAIGATTSVYFTRMLDQLGVLDQMKPKIKFVSDQHTADYVAKGEADMAVQLGNELLAVPDVEFVPLPPEFRTQDFIFAAGIATGAKEPEAGRALIRFLVGRRAWQVIKDKHLEPG